MPCPRTLAVFDAAGGSYAGYACVGTRDELEQIVLRLAGVGFFAKPARAASGDGGVAVLGLEGDRVMLGDGRKVQVRDFVDELASRGRALIQERLLQHAVLRAAVGETIATVRVAVLRGAERSEIHRAVLRIPVGRNMTDNFHRGENGNLLGRVDPATGVVDRVYGDTGLEQRRVATHPDTAAPLEGLVLPDWPAALALVDRASRALAGMALQSWDLALTERGPLMIEVNDVSSQDVLQLCGPPGMLDEHLCAFLRRRGFRWPYPHREADR